MDKLGANFFDSIESINQKLSDKTVVMQLPNGSAGDFAGIVDLIKMKYYTFSGQMGTTVTEHEVPAEMLEKAKEYRERIIETASSFDDDLAMAYLDGAEVTEAMIKKAIRIGVTTNKLYPIFCGSALGNKGVQLVLDAVIDYLPSPLDR